MGTTKGVLSGTDNPHDPVPCKTLQIVPVRYALTTEETMLPQDDPAVVAGCPVKSVKEGAAAGDYRYTLRTLREGYVHAYVPEAQAPFQKRSWAILNGDIVGASHLEFQTCWKEAYLAYSFVAWDKDAWERRIKGLGTAPKRMHKVVLSDVSHNTETFCRAWSDAKKYVEEFRKGGGLRGLHELKPCKAYFDSDTSHFNSDQHRSWQYSHVQWRKPQTLLAPRRFDFYHSKPYPFFAALADPMGIVADCASLHKTALNAILDHSRWYGGAVALAETVNSMDGSINYAQRRRWYGSGICYSLTGEYAKRMKKLDSMTAELAEFWADWFDNASDYSLQAVLGDVAEGGRSQNAERFVYWERAMADGLHTFTAHPGGVRLAAGRLSKGNSNFFRLIKITLEQSSWANGKTVALEKPDEPFGNIVSALSTLFITPESDGTIPKGTQELFTILENMLKNHCALPEEPATDDQEFYEFVTMTALGRTAANGLDPTQGMPFSDQVLLQREWTQENAASDKFASKTAKNIVNTILKARKANYTYFKSIPYLQRKFEHIGSSLSPSVCVSLTVLNFGLCANSLVNALEKLTKDFNVKDDEYTWRNMAEVLQHSIGTIESLCAIQSLKGRTVAISVLQHGIRVVSAYPVRIVLLIRPIIRKIAGSIIKRASFVLTAGLAAFDGYKSFQKEDGGAVVGNLLLIGSVCMTTAAGITGSGVMAALAVPVFIVGTIMVIAGESDRTTFRLERGYFGEDPSFLRNRHAEIEESPKLSGAVTHFSYKKKRVPDGSAICKGTSSRLWLKRQEAVALDTVMLQLHVFDFTLTSIRINDGWFGMDAVAIIVSITNFYIAGNLYIEKATLNDNDITGLVQKAVWLSALDQHGQPSWFCSLPWSEIKALWKSLGSNRLSLGIRYDGVPKTGTANNYLLDEDQAYRSVKQYDYRDDKKYRRPVGHDGRTTISCKL